MKSIRCKMSTSVRKKLKEDILRYKQEGILMVQGDLNSEIGERKK